MIDNVIILAFFLTVFVSFFISFITIRLYRRLGWLDNPERKKHPKNVHKTPVPRGGGIPIFFSILFGSLIFFPLDKHLVGILLGALILMILGILDDVYDLDPKLRLMVNFLAAMVVVGFGIGISYISNPFSDGVIMLNQPQIPIFLLGKVRTIWVLSDIFALIWIVSLMNFVNWSKGLDGQLPGMVVVAGLAIAILSQRFSAEITQWETGLLAVILAAAYLGFLFWNFYPQKIMPGYGGGSLAGYFLAVLAILSTTKVGTLTIVLGVPLVDAIYVVIRRIADGKSPFWGDTRHLHHSLMRLGWGKRRIAIFYWLITFLLAVVALILNSQQKLYTIILLFIGFGGIILWLKRLKIS